MSIPNIYDLTHFNKKTHNIVVNLRYNQSENHIEITYDNITTTDSISAGRDSILYNIKNSSICMDLLKQKMCGFYLKIDDRFDIFKWISINHDCIINVSNDVKIYFHKPNIPHPYEICSIDEPFLPFGYRGFSYISPFILFSDESIDPVPYFDLDKMKYIKQYIHMIPDTKLKLVYMIYKFHNMVFIYNSHIIENDRKIRIIYWDEIEKCFHCNFNSEPRYIYFYCNDVDFTPVIGKYDYTMIYSYNSRGKD